MPFIPHTKEDIRVMLETIGASDIEDLLAGIPSAVRLKEPLNLPLRMSELEVIDELRRLADMNRVMTCFAGGGVYDHFRPAALDAIISRPEFYTAYTPYQPEVSQGTLQAIWEYQSLICELTDMEVANASLYCGGTALAEAAALSVRYTKRGKVLAAATIHPNHLQILRTYGAAFPFDVEIIPAENGVIDLKKLKVLLDNDTAAVMIQHPNFFGLLEEMGEFEEMIHHNESLFIISFDPISLGLLKSPGEYGADIAVAEGQTLGNAMNYGGPYLGVMAAKQKFVRKIPGRLVGQTTDTNGRRGYMLALQTREQHIRREGATSNICTNQALCALAAAGELCFLGKSGIVEMAEQSLQKAHYLAEKIVDETNFKLKCPDGYFFKEFLITSKYKAKPVIDKLAEKKLLLGPSLGRFKPGADEYSFLMAVTESRTKREMDWVVEELKQFD
ncbi:MAG: aminomethyl-transferring glycine dehydrogenase subunit GcvPA [candidate division Zixibacteria bacterium]|nr:aminomethyl-transferring glycine dehydrogenase subunit GcvPA [Candidatus Tariuqbacter arcticus]